MLDENVSGLAARCDVSSACADAMLAQLLAAPPPRWQPFAEVASVAGLVAMLVGWTVLATFFPMYAT